MSCLRNRGNVLACPATPYHAVRDPEVRSEEQRPRDSRELDSLSVSSASVVSASEDFAGERGRRRRSGHGAATRAFADHPLPVARALSGGVSRGLADATAVAASASDQRCKETRGGACDAAPTDDRDALERPPAGETGGAEPGDRSSDLEDVRIAAASGRDVQVQYGSRLRREARGHHRSVSGPARTGAGASRSTRHRRSRR